MSTDIDGRISRLLDQLESPSISETSIKRIEQKLAMLQSMQEEQA